jgi:hypothetical protein
MPGIGVLSFILIKSLVDIIYFFSLHLSALSCSILNFCFILNFKENEVGCFPLTFCFSFPFPYLLKEVSQFSLGQKRFFNQGQLLFSKSCVLDF